MPNIPTTQPLDNTESAALQRFDDTFRVPHWMVRSQMVSPVWSQDTRYLDSASPRLEKKAKGRPVTSVIFSKFQNKDPIEVLSRPVPTSEDDGDTILHDGPSDREQHSEAVRRARLLHKLQSEAGGKAVVQVTIVSGSVTPNAFRAISTALFQCSERSYNRVFYFRPGDVCRTLRAIGPTGSISGSETQSLEDAFIALANVRVKTTLTQDAGEVSREQRRLLETETPLVSWVTTSRLTQHSVTQRPISSNDLDKPSRRRTWTVQLSPYGEILMLMSAYGKCSHSGYCKLKRAPIVRWATMCLSTHGHSASGKPLVTRRPSTLISESGLAGFDEALFLVNCRAGVLSPDAPLKGPQLRRRAQSIQRKCRMLHESTKQIAAAAGFAFFGLRDGSVNSTMNFLRPPHEALTGAPTFPDKALQPEVDALSMIEQTCLGSLTVNPRSSYQRQATAFLKRLGRTWSEEFLNLKGRLDELMLSQAAPEPSPTAAG